MQNRTRRFSVPVTTGLTLALVLAACAGPGEDAATETRSGALTRAEVDGFFNKPTSWVLQPGHVAAVSWKYTTTQPASSWKDKTFNDASWATGQPGFAPPGAGPMPEDVNRTTWAAAANKIWLRKTFTISAANIPKAIIWARWDDNIKVYINGVLTAEMADWTPSYRYFGISSEARATLSSTGSNTIAVEVEDLGGGKYIDVGIAINQTLQSRPVAGVPATPTLNRYTEAVQRFMVKYGIPAASLAVMKGDNVVLTQGFGWKTKAFTGQVPADAVMRLASIDKMLTMFAVKKMIRDGAVDPVTGQAVTEQTPAFPLMLHAGTIPANAGPYNQALNVITIGDLLQHVGGMAEVADWSTIAADLGKSADALNQQDNIVWIYRQPLNFTPGTCPFPDGCYSSTGYSILRYVVQSLKGEIVNYLRNDVLAMTGNDDVLLAYERLENRDPREPWYQTGEVPFPRWVHLENFTALSTSAELLVRALRYYHNGDGGELFDPVTGQYSPSDNGAGVSAGGMAGTSTFAIQRRWDEVSLAILFNQGARYDAIVDELFCITDGLPDSAFTTAPGALTLKPFFSFENDWEWTSPQATLSVLPTPATHGAGALAVPGVGYVRAVSRDFDTCEIMQPTSNLKLDVFIPPNQPNPSWLGTVAVEVNCPAVSHYRFMGPVNLTGKAQGQFHTLSFTVPSSTVTLLDKGRDTCHFAVTLNASANSGTWRFDKLRFE
jgi:CubicO group peptidase (beta-lactamase class C family)